MRRTKRAVASEEDFGGRTLEACVCCEEVHEMLMVQVFGGYGLYNLLESVPDTCTNIFFVITWTCSVEIGFVGPSFFYRMFLLGNRLTLTIQKLFFQSSESSLE